MNIDIPSNSLRCFCTVPFLFQIAKLPQLREITKRAAEESSKFRYLQLSRGSRKPFLVPSKIVFSDPTQTLKSVGGLITAICK